MTVRLRPHQRARIRPVALGAVLGAGARSHLLQTPGVRARADRSSLPARFPQGRPAVTPVVGQSDRAAAATVSHPRRRTEAASPLGRLASMLGKDGGRPLVVRQRTSGRCRPHCSSPACSSACSRSTSCTSSAATTPATIARRWRSSAPSSRCRSSTWRRPTVSCAPNSPSSTPSASAARASRRRWRAPWATCRRRWRASRRSSRSTAAWSRREPPSVGVKIEQLRITAGHQPGDLYRPHVAGALGTCRQRRHRHGAAEPRRQRRPRVRRTLDLAALTAGKQRELRYNFRYLENFDQELSVPPSFKPERLNVEVQLGPRGVAPLSQTFLWNVEAVSVSLKLPGRRPSCSPAIPEQPRIDTLIGKAARVHGDVEFQGGLHLDGHIAGRCSLRRSPDATLSVSASRLHRGSGGGAERHAGGHASRAISMPASAWSWGRRPASRATCTTASLK